MNKIKKFATEFLPYIVIGILVFILLTTFCTLLTYKDRIEVLQERSDKYEKQLSDYESQVYKLNNDKEELDERLKKYTIVSPCPICHSEVEVVFNANKGTYSIYCNNCYLESGSCKEKNKLIEFWNSQD